MKKITAILLALTMLATYCTAFGEESFIGEITVGLCLPMTGPNATVGLNWMQGIQEVIDQTNAAGGVQGYKMSVKKIDSSDDPDTGINAVNLMVEEDVVAVIGPHYSSQDFAVREVIEKHGIPFIVGGTNYKLPSTDNNYMFLGRTNDQIQAGALAQYIIDNTDCKKVGIMYCSDDFGQGGCDVASGVFDAGGMEYVSEPHTVTDTDYYSTLLKMQSAGCDALFIWTLSNTMTVLVRQIDELGLKDTMQIFTSPATGTAALIEAVDHNWLKDIYTVQESLYDAGNPNIVAFGESYKATYGVLPDGDARAYGSIMMLLLDALKRAEDPTNREAVKKALEETKDVETLFSVYTCDELNMLNHSITLCQWNTEMDGLAFIQKIVG